MDALVGLTIMSMVADNYVSAGSGSSLATAFEANGVVPDVISAAPGGALQVKYPSGVSVSEGNELTPTQVKDIPQVAWDARPDAFYTLCMIDPDAPSREKPTSREALHWLVVNIRGGDLASGDTLAAYVGSGPPPGSGLHRYVFIVYLQPAKIQFDHPHFTNTRFDEGRRKFSIAKFASKYELGEPQFGNFYQAKYDDYVPILYKQLTGGA